MIVEVKVHPSSKRPRALTDSSGLLHIYVSQPALEDKANQAVLKVLTERYSISKSRVKLVSGLKSKKKIFNIVDLSA